MIFFYNISIALYVFAVRIASLWNAKAKLWLQGRRNIWQHLQQNIQAEDRVIWMHCSSAGEFEQGKPVIEKLKSIYSDHKILVSFFSPSGYTVAQKYAGADVICYLPVDTRRNARRFLDLVHPSLVIFVKYEFWYYHLQSVAIRHIPLLLISASFRRNQAFFKSYGGFYRNILFLFNHLFVQDQSSQHILQQNGINHCSIGGDTRFDRVKEIADNFRPVDHIHEFINSKPVIVAGSTWPGDEQLLAKALVEKDQITRLIIAPHEIHEHHIQDILKLFPDAVRYSSLSKQPEAGSFATRPSVNASVLIIDNVGMLSRLYRYATICYIGGGFTKDGIHNTLEAAVYGKPVIFGPNYNKYREAGELIASGGGFSVSDALSFQQLIQELRTNEGLLLQAGTAAGRYIQENTGATGKILDYIQENRLLTRL